MQGGGFLRFGQKIGDPIVHFSCVGTVRPMGIAGEKSVAGLAFSRGSVVGTSAASSPTGVTEIHLVRAVYEYEGSVPIVITVYYPSAERCFEGGRRREDQIFS